MKTEFKLFAGVLLAAGISLPAAAQLGPYRRFTAPPMDPNRNELQIYVPLAQASARETPELNPHSIATASWLAAPVGSRNRAPDLKHGDSDYLLESFSESGGILHIVVRGPAGAGGPEIRVTHPQSGIGSSAQASRVTPAAGGARYQFQVRAPHYLLTAARGRGSSDSGHYDVSFSPRQAAPPAEMQRKGTFAGQPREYQAPQGPPSSIRSRVAGKRQIFRGDR